MAIIRLEDKYKSKYKIQLTPQRHYVSSSSGITGSVFVFPNRSETQKDNIDERLNLAPMADEGTEFSGKPIRPYDSNSLEARRIEIYQGQFGKLIGGMFSDAIQYEYTWISGNSGSNWPDGIAGTIAKTGESINDSLAFVTNDIIERVIDKAQFQWTSNANWLNYPSKSDVPLNKVLESDRDVSGKNFEIALGLLLDGANPFTEDHAWRYGGSPNGYSNAGNSSYTGGSPGDYQFTGFKVIEDELGIPYLDSPLTKKSEVNAWPPEVAKWNTSIISNFVVKGYSDLSMHPRNATKKEIIRRRADFDVFSSGSLMQKTLVNRLDDLHVDESGWWVHNNQVLSLSEYSDGGTNRVPALCYHNDASKYEIDWQTDEITYEFWIKPCKEQIVVGTVAHLGGNFGITIIPDLTTKKNAHYEKFKLGFFFGTKAANSINPASVTVSVNAVGSDDGVYITGSHLNLDTWHHVALRYGTDFNNGLLDVFIDGISITGAGLDGVNNGGTRTDGFVNTAITSTSGHSVTIGAWAPTGGMLATFGEYADKQEYSDVSNTAVYADGLAIAPRYQLKSELGDFRIWSVCRSEAQLLANRYTTLTSNSNLKFYVNFQLDPSTSSATWNHLGFVPDKDTANNTTEYYEGGELVPITTALLANDYNKTSFCTNSAFIAGMPFSNVHAHAKEYAQSTWPVITGFRDFTDDTDTILYPLINNQTPAVEKIAYFQKHWTSFGWLKCINSMILPSDNDRLSQDYTLNSKLYHQWIAPDMIRLRGAGIGNTDDQLEIKHFLDDEVFSIQDAMVKLDPNLTAFRGKEENYQTKSLIDNNKLGDNDYMSPLTTVFSIPQIYYGNRIHEESLEIIFKINEDNKEIKLVDRGGTLYRTNAKGVGIVKVGHVDYANGIVCIFSPLLVNIGLDNFDIKLKGQKNMHVMQLDIPCGPGIANKSQNPSYKSLKASANANETSGKLTYISSIYLHDENLNIVGKVNLAQPVQKREEDSFIFRVKVDF